jgi:hypothetical protein
MSLQHTVQGHEQFVHSGAKDGRCTAFLEKIMRSSRMKDTMRHLQRRLLAECPGRKNLQRVIG